MVGQFRTSLIYARARRGWVSGWNLFWINEFQAGFSAVGFLFPATPQRFRFRYRCPEHDVFTPTFFGHRRRKCPAQHDHPQCGLSRLYEVGPGHRLRSDVHPGLGLAGGPRREWGLDPCFHHRVSAWQRQHRYPRVYCRSSPNIVCRRHPSFLCFETDFAGAITVCHSVSLVFYLLCCFYIPARR